MLNLFDSVVRDILSSQVTTPSNLAVNLYHNEDQILVTTELAGVKKEDLNIEVKHQEVRISGERRVLYNDELKTNHKERESFKFDRRFRLPFAVNPDAVKAKLEHGLLTIELSKAEEAKAQKITLN